MVVLFFILLYGMNNQPYSFVSLGANGPVSVSASSLGAASQAAQATPEIPTAVDRLDEEIGRLEEQVKRLVSALSPVVNDQPVLATGVADSVARSPLGGRILTANNRLALLASDISELYQRLEL